MPEHKHAFRNYICVLDLPPVDRDPSVTCSTIKLRFPVHFLKATAFAAAICIAGHAAQAGGLAEPVEEAEAAAPEATFEPAQGSVNGGYILLGAFLAMALAAASN